MADKPTDEVTNDAALSTTGDTHDNAKVDAPVLVFGGASRAGSHGPNRDAFAACQPDEIALRSHRGVVMAIADGVIQQNITYSQRAGCHGIHRRIPGLRLNAQRTGLRSCDR